MPLVVFYDYLYLYDYLYHMWKIQFAKKFMLFRFIEELDIVSTETEL